MRKKLLFRSLSLAFLAVLSLSSPKIFGAPCGGPAVQWNNDLNIVASVTDQNIDVIGTNALAAPIVVAALNCDIAINVQLGDAIITGSATTGVPPTLFLFTNVNRTITFNLADSLLFSGTALGDTPFDLLITVSGAGQVIFDIDGGESITFGKINPLVGGTFFFAGTSNPVPPKSAVVFQTNASNPTLVSQVIVGDDSLISFLGQPGIGPVNAAMDFLSLPIILPGLPNRLQLSIENGGGLRVSVIPADLTLGSALTLGDIGFGNQLPLGSTATINAINNGVLLGAAAALTVVNANNACPTAGLLIDPFCNGVTTTVSPGFVLVAPNVLNVASDTYFDYIGTATNVCCTFTLLNECSVTTTQERLRNGSAFIVDSPDDSTFATINLNSNSAIYFRSGVDNCGSVNPDFLTSPSVETPCAGNIVLDVEGPLNITGADPDTTAVEILSLQVVPSGCPVTVDALGSGFPQRTFVRDANGDYLQYNLGAFLVNNRMNFISTSLVHTDSIHNVYENFNLGNPTLFSEPTYVGGDSYLLSCHLGRCRPTMAFINSKFRVHTSVASTGVDYLFPNSEELSNTSSLIFYSNGRCIDDGYGRNMILGTGICFENCITSTDLDSHLNVFQEVEQDDSNDLVLWLLTAPNTPCITEGIPSAAAIAGQNSVQTIYLNNASNISIGTNGAVGTACDGSTFDLTVPAVVNIDGSFFSFETRGGTIALPQASGTTGEGGIFVDALGELHLLNNRIASFGAMVTKSRSGIVDLPSNQAFFAPRIGIAEWQPNMSDPVQRVLVEQGEQLSDYTMDWGAIIQTYCCNTLITDTSCFIPYEPESVPAVCAAPVVTTQNLTNLPTIQGEIDQLQILRARIGSPAHLLIDGLNAFDGGFVRELVFLQGFNSAEAPTAFLVLQNDGFVGLGSAHKDVDSLEASIVLGINGVMLVANGNGNVELNEDVIINNVCHILSGTAFGQTEQQFLTISSTTPKELRIKSTGVLDLTQFDTPNKVLEITGQVKLVCEPGARIILNGGSIRFSGQAQWFIDPVFDTQVPAGVNVTTYDDIRVKLSGVGGIEMAEDASMFIPENAFFGIETFVDCSTVTDIEMLLLDQASVQIGSEEMPGGVFQVGDALLATSTFVRSISFRLDLDGIGALFQVDRLGFFGLAAGIVNKQPNTNPSEWTAGCLSNVDTVTINITDNGGTFRHDQIASALNPIASLFAIGSVGTYSFTFDLIGAVILAGGNFVKLNCFVNDDGGIVPTSASVTVTTFAGVQPGGFVETNIMSGKMLLVDTIKGPQPVGVSAQTLYDYLKVTEHDVQRSPRANIASNQLNRDNLGFVYQSIIRRDVLPVIRGTQGNVVSDQHSLQIGAVSLNIDDASGAISNAIEILGTRDF